MGKTRQRRATQIQEKNVGCTWGLIRMFYSRRDPKLILDRKQGNRRHSFSGFPGRGHLRRKSRDFEEIDEDRDNMEECSTTKSTVKRLMEGELSKQKQPKKIPNDEVQRILADLGHDACLDKSTTQNSKPEGITNPKADISIASSSASLDPSGSKSMKHAEEDNIELALSDFLGEVALSDFMGEVYKYHDEGADDCMSNSELCPELKSLIDTNLDEFSNPLCDLAYKKILVSEGRELVDNKHLHNRYVGNRLETKRMTERSNIIEDTKSSNQHELVIKTKNKESKNIFFWKKDKSSRQHTPERSSQPVNKIVILKPNPKAGFGPIVATASTQAPGYRAAECSTFSVKEVRRRFRIVTGENRKGRPSVNEDEVQGDPCRPRHSVFTIKKDSRQVPPATAKNDVKHSDSSMQKQINGELAVINSDISTSKDASIFYAEAKKHLTEILKDKSHTDKYPSPTVQISRSLVRMLSLPQCTTSSSTGSTPRVKHCIELSPEDKDICAVHKAEREESANGRKESEENPESVECEASDQQADQERHYNEEATKHGVELDVMCIEEIDKPDHSETIHSAQCIPAEQHIYNSPLDMMEGANGSKEHDEMFPGSPENVIENREHQDPETPIPSTSLELISQEENHEKQEQPSPVSVLEPLFHEDANSPDNKSTIKCDLRQDVLRPQYYLDARSDQEIFWEDRDARLGYIKAVLELSELYTHKNPEIWNLEDELISTCVFEELHQHNQTDDVKLFFDCVCQAITVVQGTHFRNTPCLPFLTRNIKAPPTGHNLVSEINKHIEGHLCYQFPSTLDHLVDKDLEECSWMDLRPESRDVAVDIWEFLLDELLEDVSYDLLI
ncbi:uncharacterized protein [Lolium perenne]|uniref:uncharacterized protein isoform X1 n=1 Tax=Lolium perenne TaxID=4522 RepID=UPI0021EAE3F4|nr:uncharacterized protein LOC127297401 isoform X1 [Lolium perenne]